MRTLAELTRADVAGTAPVALLVLPFGAVEQHGPHLPFATDLMIVEAVCRLAAERADGPSPVVVAPAAPYGSSAHHLEVGGALSLGAGTFERCARDLICSAADSGFRRVFCVNGHGGNEQLLQIAAQAAGRERRLAVGGGSYWTLARDALERILPDPALIPGHAGRFETSLVLALRPELAGRPSRREDPPAADEPVFWLQLPEWWQEIDGYSDDPADGTAAEGAACLEAIADAVAASLSDFDRRTVALELA